MMIPEDKQFLSSDDIKQHLCKMLVIIDSFCRDNGIRYFLAYGTLLGAIRHKGFIPWDDDIDLWMPRPDYNRFIHLFKHDNLRFHSPETDPEWPLNFGKVCDEAYSAVDNFGNDTGLYIDIFPLEGMPDNPREAQRHIEKVRRLERLWSNQLFTRKVSLLKNVPLRSKVYAIIGKIIHLFIPFPVIRKRLSDEYMKYDFERVESVCCVVNGCLLFKKEVFIPACLGEFEHNTYFIPNGYDYCLRALYDDYMELPPEEKRYSHGLMVRKK